MTILIIDFLICLFIWFAVRIWFKIDKMVTVMIILVYFFALSPYFHDFIGTKDAEQEHIEEWEDEDDSDFFVGINMLSLKCILASHYTFLKKNWI